MNIELISDQTWIAVIQGTRHVKFEFLALQLLLVNLRNRQRAGEISLPECIRELKAFHRKFSHLPMAARDFQQIANEAATTTAQLLDPDEVARRITAGQSLMLAGEEALLAALPPGNWIGGTSPYFMSETGGCLCRDKIFATEIPGEFPVTLHQYTAADLPGLYEDAGEGMVSFVILPADSPTHCEFAMLAPGYAGFALHPLVGWVAGLDPNQPARSSPKVFCGGPKPLADAAAVLRLKLPPDCLAQINIINLFQPGTGDSICFPTTGFSATTALINGREQNLAEYFQHLKADTRLPLVANYCGAMVNISLRNVDPANGRVDFYAPVIAGTEYRLATPVGDYIAAFETRLRQLAPDRVLFSCNCILNYLYSQLEGRRTGNLVGPVTFGEIAFQLLNQTLVYLEIVQVGAAEPREISAQLHEARLELSAAHEEILAGEQRFRTLGDFAPIGIFLTDASGRVLYHNRCCEQLTGVPLEEAGTGNWLRNIHPHDLPGLQAALQKSERADLDFEHEFRFLGPADQIRWVHSQATLLRSEAGEITGRIGTVKDITERKQSEIEIERVNQSLIRASREAGIAEMATGVLHNVKNVVNSLNVSASVISDQVRKSQSPNLAKVTALLREHAADLGVFITEHPKGKLVPDYLEKLAAALTQERTAILDELQQFDKNVQHIKDIVCTQQGYARLGGASETTKPVDLMEDSLLINAAGLARHGIQVEREYADHLPEVTVEKPKVLQILVNLIRNAKQACQASGRPGQKVVLQVANGGEFIRFTVRDNGIGIPPENLNRLFEHGFTTKKDGHGFGLHSAALAVRELGGDLTAQSDGDGTGATFSLKLPLCPPVEK